MVKRRAPSVESFLHNTEEFFRDAFAEMTRKSGDYQNDGKAFGDVFAVAEETNMRPIFILYIHMCKHLTAIRRFVNGNDLKSEDIQGRLIDAANYCAMMSQLIKLERRRESLNPPRNSDDDPFGPRGQS